jgi:hypothetical protein
LRRGGLVVLFSLLTASGAAADTYVGAGGGAVVPWSGDVGWSVMGEIGTDLSSEYFRLGGEFSYSSYDQSLDYRLLGLGQIPIEMRTYELRLVTRYVLFPGKLTPYIGGGGHLALIDANDWKVRALVRNPFLVRSGSSLGFGGGLLGLVGLELPLFTKQLNLFAEGRVAYTWEITSNLGPGIGPDNFSGFQGIAGIRARF